MKRKIERQTVFAERIIDSFKVERSEYLVKTTELQPSLNDYPVTALKVDSYIVFDFSKEIYGVLRIVTKNAKGTCKIRVRLGESVAETYSELNENGATNDHSLRDCVYPVGLCSQIKTSDCGFRFARIDLVCGEELELFAVTAETEFCGYPKKGFFVSDDKELNKIVEIAERTAELCIQNGYLWDGIKRDKLVWAGDLHPEILTVLNLFGNVDEIKNSLDLTEKQFDFAWVNKIPAYSAWWIICLRDFYLYTGDSVYTASKIKFVKKIISDFSKIIKDDGAVDYSKSPLEMFADNDFFFDWPTNFKKDGKIGWVCLVAIAADCAVKLFEAFGENANDAKALHKKLLKNSVTRTNFKQVEAFCYLSGRKNAKDVLPELAKNKSEGMTCFLGYYILKALTDCGDKANVLEMIKEFYGGMISLGATTFWEDFDIDWMKECPQGLAEIPVSGKKNIHRDYGKFCYTGFRHSLCHGWASGIYAFLVESIAGIKPKTTGFKDVIIRPNLCGLKTIKCCVPTPQGEISVEHSDKNGKIYSKIIVPEGVVVDYSEIDSVNIEHSSRTMAD